MKADPELTRAVRSWLREDGGEDAGRVVFEVLEKLDDTPQLGPRWLAPLGAAKWTMRLLGVAAAVAAIAVSGYLLLPRTNVGSGPSPSVVASPSAAWDSSLLPLDGGPIDPGRYRLRPAGFEMDASFEVPAGWSACWYSANEQGVCRGESGLSFYDLENVVADPCGEELLDPPLGPTVHDFVTAVSALDGFGATPPVEVIVSGYRGTEITLTAPADPGCPSLLTWATADRTNGVGASEVNVLTVLDVDGRRVVIARASFPWTSETVVAELEAIVDSIEITANDR